MDSGSGMKVIKLTSLRPLRTIPENVILTRTRPAAIKIRSLAIRTAELARTMDSITDVSLPVPINLNREFGESMSQALGILSLSPLTFKKPSFNVFQKLPIEVRLKIWKLAELDPRLIVLKCVVGRPTQVAPLQGEPLLAVCREPRSEAQKTYKLYNWKGSPQRYLRSDVDIFYFPEVGLQGSDVWGKVTSILRLLGRSDMRHMKHLALDLTL
ncbi:hypothetical protein NA56DRAFT_24732 [Hyaloscypha hepaticicola]|uniref:2EXR domain-containing protein n=1 Tax=Hyaloscypha hepaticicola TaxID=2082293 RepID=A0A2J6QCS7_9HELO|nr:hypothetical protein NA56DRAFT_24732 [Hyaloscypha hepaticicola]